MEARGIEPRSEPRSQTVSTCIGCALSSPEAGTRPSDLQKSSLKSHAGLESKTPTASLTLRYPRTASGGLPRGQVRSNLLTQPEPIQSWQLLVFPVFLPGSEDLDTQQNLHQARRSQSPPDIEEIYGF